MKLNQPGVISFEVHLDSGPRNPNPLCDIAPVEALPAGHTVTNEIGEVTCSNCECIHDDLTKEEEETDG